MEGDSLAFVARSAESRGHSALREIDNFTNADCFSYVHAFTIPYTFSAAVNIAQTNKRAVHDPDHGRLR
jgi:hypothetical protein